MYVGICSRTTFFFLKKEKIFREDITITKENEIVTSNCGWGHTGIMSYLCLYPDTNPCEFPKAK
jgi:hypothetical protein